MKVDNLLKISKPRSVKGLAVFFARIAEAKLASNIVILNLTKIEMAPAEYFVICTCDSEPQIRALVDEINRMTIAHSMQKSRTEGLDSPWVLMDFFDVVVHIMMPKSHEFYKLEKLWGDAQFLALGEDSKPIILNNEEKYKYLA